MANNQGNSNQNSGGNQGDGQTRGNTSSGDQGTMNNETKKSSKTGQNVSEQ
jgi:hypothetical protein